ncbi:MAG: hypothetical protein E7469_08500 [Ruminococcaceae bacterium]|nr:hypothetical protein [Oscillospiraceae bacterium]
MLGWIICGEERRITLERQVVGGLPFWVLRVPHRRRWLAARGFTAALREMARRGVRRVVVQGGEVPELALFGMTAVEPWPLRRALLPQLLDWAEREWQLPLRTSAVLLSADSSGADTCRAARLLCQRARYVLLDTGVGQAELEARLRSTEGLGVGGGKPVLEVCLRAESRSGVPVLYLGRGCAAQQRLELTASGLENGEESLLCALFQAEKLPIEEIHIRFVEFRA